jgi:pSer/pThr/pTyr-binding forkhead associated (FHA) protein
MPPFGHHPLSPPVLYCLRGGISDRDRTWLLPAGESTLGSSEANDLVLAVTGVSRQHACLRVDGGRGGGRGPQKHQRELRQ